MGSDSLRFKRISHSTVLVTETCCECGVLFAMPESLNSECQNNEKRSFYCPNGHGQHYSESEATKLRRERDSLKQDQARLFERLKEQREAKEAAQRSANAFKGQVTKLRRRAASGVCPCCNRQFENLHRHMKTKHPDFGPDESFTVIEGGKKTA